MTMNLRNDKNYAQKKILAQHSAIALPLHSFSDALAFMQFFKRLKHGCLI